MDSIVCPNCGEVMRKEGKNWVKKPVLAKLMYVGYGFKAYRCEVCGCYIFI